MDNLDIKIISLLQQEGRATNTQVARQVGVSEETVRRRLKRLIQEEYIRVVAQPDPAKLGYELEVLIGLKTGADKVDQVAESIAQLDEVNWVSVTTGSFDVFAWATLRSSQVLGDFLRERMGVIPGVRKMETFVNLDIKKRRCGLGL